jgi:spermidine synthase
MSPFPTPRLSPGLGAALTFVAAASVLILEIAAARLLAPYTGVSLGTYTAIIGVILGAIALGAWTGGRAADVFGPERLLGPAFVAGGLTAMAAVPIVAIVGLAGLGGGPAGSVILSAVGFVAPAAVLSAIAPLIVRARLTDVTTSGALVGRLSAIGTAGALAGTFLTGFVLLGLVPTRLLIVSVGALLVVVGVAVGWRLRRSLAALAAGLIASLALGGLALAAPSPCERESVYFCIAVEDGPDDQMRTLILDRLTHASVDLADPTELRFGYVRRFADASAGLVEARDGAPDVLHLGGGGFTFPRYLEAIAPASTQTILELDPAILRVARDELGYMPSDDTRILLGDARGSVTTLLDDSFDLAVGDAFGGLAVPWHLTTREFLAEIDRVLRPDGLYVMNLIDGPSLAFVRAEAATARSLFGHVAIVAAPAMFEGSMGGNVVLVASHGPIDAADLAARIAAHDEPETTAVVAEPAAVEAFVHDAPLLTDDFAPVDQLLGR